MGQSTWGVIMRAFIFAGLIALAAAKGVPKSKFTALARGGGKIVGGEDASYGEFPHQIMLLRGGPDGSLMCGGSLVSPNMVVTAGHCCDGQSANRLGIRVGNHHLYEDDPDQMDFPVKKVMLHEDYDSWTITNDICMIEIDGQADFSSSVIGAISLPSSGKEYDAGTQCTVSGWGTTSEGGSLGRQLMKVTVPVVSDDDCRGAYGQSDITDSMICAGLDQGGKDSCQGDSGGPFMCGDGLSGVVSWGYGCAEPGYPGVYTQVSYFIDWVNSHM